MSENVSKKKVELMGDALLGIDYKKQYLKAIILTGIFGLSYVIFSHIALLLITVLLAAGTVERYIKYSKFGREK